MMNKEGEQTMHTCDYKCNAACDGCTAPHLISACRKCAHGAIKVTNLNNNNDDNKTNLTTATTSVVCVDRCPSGFNPDLLKNKLCTGKQRVSECFGLFFFYGF